MSAGLATLSWPAERLGEAFQALASTARLIRSDVALPAQPPAQEVGPWLDAAGRQLGIEVEEVEARYFELETVAGRGGPAVVALPAGAYLLLLGASSGRARVLGPDLKIHRVAAAEVRAALAAHLEKPVGELLDTILDGARIPERRRRRTRRLLLAQYLDPHHVGRCWILRAPPSASFARQLWQARVLSRTVWLVLCHLTQYVLFLGSWWLIGRGALTGSFDGAWLAGWALLLLSLVPLRMLTVLLQGRVVLDAGALLKRRLLAGVMKLDLETIKHEGAGMLLGRVLESNALEAVVLTGGYLALLSTIEVAVTMWVLAQGAGGHWHALIFACWAGLIAGLVWRFYLSIHRWTGVRLELTHDLTERMVGHRTRLAQQDPESWHEGEDELLHRYLDASRRMDGVGPWVAQAQFGWRIVGLLGLAAPIVSGHISTANLAVGFGGIMLGSQALGRLTSGFSGMAVAAIAWRHAAPIFRAAARAGDPGSMLGASQTPTTDGGAVISAHELSYAYPGRTQKALSRADLSITMGDRLLLMGPSGGGKSTLVSLLAGIRKPSTGLLLCHGLDLATLGAEGWRARVAAAPQFHENHVLSETFAFNLLMGRSWPPTREVLAEAEQLCRELGLGPLLDRMPAGMMQMVGDTGWQLSHGERSRLFVARALIQDADLVILDESFGALDPESLKVAVNCARRRARTLMVVAHP